MSLLIAALDLTRQQRLQKETGHRYTPTSGQEAIKLYSPDADSKAARAVFCEYGQMGTIPVRLFDALASLTTKVSAIGLTPCRSPNHHIIDDSR